MTFRPIPTPTDRSRRDATVLFVHTDGACHKNPGPGGWGAFWTHPAGETVELLGGEPRTTNNRMELTGPLQALLALRDHPGKICVRSDSQYVVKGATVWRSGWEKRGWRSSQGDPVKNEGLWRALFAAIDALGPRVGFEWVRGHNGDPHNERADRLALEGLRQAQGHGRTGAWRRVGQQLHPIALAGTEG